MHGFWYCSSSSYSVPVFISGVRNHGIGSIGSMDNHVCVTNQYASQIASGNYPTAVVTNNANAINGVAQLNSEYPLH